MIIPDVSDEDCVLVFKTGLPAGGMVMTLPSLEEQIANRTFGRNDLILYNGTWMPIGSVFDSIPEPLPPPEPQGEELATQFSELEPIEGFTPLSQRGKKHLTSPFIRRTAHIFSLLVHSKAIRICLIAIAALLLLAGGWYGGGLLINTIWWKPVYIMVFNPNDAEVEARLEDKRLTIPSHGHAAFQDIILPWSRTQTLQLFKAGKEVFTRPLALVPGTDIIVNPTPGKRLFICHLDKTKEFALPQETVDEIARAIGGHASPNAVDKLDKQLKETMGKIAGEVLKDEVFTSREYVLSQLDVKRSERYNAKMSGKSITPPALPTLVPSTEISITIQEKQCVYDLEKQHFKELKFAPTKQTKPTATPFNAGKFKDRHVALTPAHLTAPIHLTYQKGQPELKTTIEKAELSLNKIKYTGNWSYEAIRNDKGQWKWTWVFHGKSASNPKNKKEKPKQLKLHFEHSFSGQETLK